jgi:hypothetical protein
MAGHKFRVGQTVRLQRDSATSATGHYEVIRLLPATVNGEFQYRIKAVHEAYERMAAEHQLTSAGGSGMPDAQRTR